LTLSSEENFRRYGRELGPLAQLRVERSEPKTQHHQSKAEGDLGENDGVSGKAPARGAPPPSEHNTQDKHDRRDEIEQRRRFHDGSIRFELKHHAISGDRADLIERLNLYDRRLPKEAAQNPTTLVYLLRRARRAQHARAVFTCPATIDPDAHAIPILSNNYTFSGVFHNA